MSNGFSFASLLLMWMAAFRVPLELGSKVTLNLTLPYGARDLFAGWVRVKSLGLAPSFVIFSPVRFAEPVFRMVKVFVLPLRR